MGAVKTEDPVVAAGKMAGALRRRFASALFCRGFLAASGIAGFAAGGVILAGRLVDGDWPFAASAAEAGVLVVPGAGFMTDPETISRSFRLNYSTPSDEAILRGMEILGRLTHSL